MKKEDYKIIPLLGIEDNARELAIDWIENFRAMPGIQIEQKRKLASDIMNYAIWYSKNKYKNE